MRADVLSASSVDHTSVVGFCSPSPVLARSVDKSTKVTTAGPPHVGFASDVPPAGNPECLRSPEDAGWCGGHRQSSQGGTSSTGLTMELRGVTLSPPGGGHVTSSPCQSVRSLKHCLDFDDSEDSCVRSTPKVQRTCDGRCTGEPSGAANCVTAGKSLNVWKVL